jgi:hypothetical protein
MLPCKNGPPIAQFTRTANLPVGFKVGQDETDHDDESARGPMRCFSRIFIFAGKFLFDLHKLRPEFRISFANHPGPCAQCDVAACHRLRFACQLSLNMPLGRFPISKRISQGTTDAARIF